MPVGERHQLSLTTSEAPGDWARGSGGERRRHAAGVLRRPCDWRRELQRVALFHCFFGGIRQLERAQGDLQK